MTARRRRRGASVDSGRVPFGEAPAHVRAAAERVALYADRVLRYRGLGARAGARWYDYERAAFEDIAGAAGVPLARVVGAAVALAPRKRWERVREAVRLRVMEGLRLSGFYARSWDRAERALVGEDPWALFPAGTSPKSADFYRALADPLSADPVIDVWAARIAGLPLRGVRDYRDAAAAYHYAVGELGERARGVVAWDGARHAPMQRQGAALRLQAMTWCAARDWGVPLPEVVVPERV